MNSLNTLHITDLHYSGTSSEIGDAKDKRVSRVLTEEVCYENSHALFLDMVSELVEKEKIALDMIACTGDIGSGANLEATVPRGMQYLAKLAKRLDVKAKDVLVSPGNHDLDRKHKKKELDFFCVECSKEGFRFASRTDALCTTKKGVPVVVLNSCLGGTEHALLGMPEEIWDQTRSALKELESIPASAGPSLTDDLRSRLEALDIPAIGKSQTGQLLTYLQKSKANCALVLAHHAPAATPNVEIRPYATMLDSGPFLSRLTASGQRVILLHGHAHCDSSLTICAPEEENDGFVTAIGGRGLHGYGEAGACIIRIFLDSERRFLVALVRRFNQRGSTWMRGPIFYLFNRSQSVNSATFSLDGLESNVGYPFEEAAKRIRVPADTHFAEALLRAAGQPRLRLSNLEKPQVDWVVTRIDK